MRGCTVAVGGTDVWVDVGEAGTRDAVVVTCGRVKVGAHTVLVGDGTFVDVAVVGISEFPMNTVV